jgi:hypothetical protein
MCIGPRFHGSGGPAGAGAALGGGDAGAALAVMGSITISTALMANIHERAQRRAVRAREKSAAFLIVSSYKKRARCKQRRFAADDADLSRRAHLSHRVRAGPIQSAP